MRNESARRTPRRCHERELTVRQANALNGLMDLSDNDLLDLLLRRREPEGELLRDDVIEVLGTSTDPRLPTNALDLVLMVEDDHATLTALSRGLEREGINVHGVRSAEIGRAHV